MYQAYLLRCWREEQAAPDGKPGWRFSVEEVLHERRQRGFTSLESVLGYLQAELAAGRVGSADSLAGSEAHGTRSSQRGAGR
jgi:hypothetical protein